MKKLPEILNIGFLPQYPPFFNKTDVTATGSGQRSYPVSRVVTLSELPFNNYRAARLYKPISRIVSI